MMPICLLAPLLAAAAALAAEPAALGAAATNPTVTFATPGPHDVTLKVCNSAGCDSVTKTIVVLDPLPKVISISGPSLLGTAQPPASYSTITTGRPPTFDTWTLTYPDASQISSAAATFFVTPIFVGAHTLSFTLANLSGTATASASISVVPSVFADVPPDYWAQSFINTLYYYGITSGCGTDAATGNPLFCPDTPITRGDLAIFVGRALHPAPYVPPVATGVFADVPASDPRAPWIEQLFRDGVTSGCQPTPVRLYCPSASLTRAEMAVLLIVATHGSPPAATGLFSDVPPSFWAAPWIEETYRRGITAGCQASPVRLFCPASNVTRAEIAVFLATTFHLTQKPTPTLFQAHLCTPSACSYPTGLPINFDVHVAGGIPAAYDWDWNGDGVYEQTTAFPVAHVYSTAGAFTPKLRLRLGSYSAVLAHSTPIVIKAATGLLLAPTNLSAAASTLRAPQPGDPPGTPIEVAYTISATPPDPSIRGYAAYVSNGLVYTFAALLPVQGGTLLLPPAPPGTPARYLSLNAFTSMTRGSGSIGIRLP